MMVAAALPDGRGSEDPEHRPKSLPPNQETHSLTVAPLESIASRRATALLKNACCGATWRSRAGLETRPT
jgi:hypothetical protein